MKLLIPAKARHIEKKDKFLGAYNLLEVDMTIDEISLDIKLQLAKENIDDSMDIFNGELVSLCEQYMEDTIISFTTDNKVREITPRQFAFIIAQLAFRAFENGSKGKSPFKVEVNMPKTKEKEFKAENRESIKEIERLQRLIKKPVTLDDVMKAINELPARLNIPSQKKEVSNIEKVEEIVKSYPTKKITPKKQEGDVDGAVRTNLQF